MTPEAGTQTFDTELLSLFTSLVSWTNSVTMAMLPSSVFRMDARRDIDQTYIVCDLNLQISRLAERSTTHSRPGSSSRDGRGANLVIVAVGKQKTGKDAADNESKEWKTRADIGHIALCYSPVGGADVVPCVGGQSCRVMGQFPSLLT